MDLEKAVIEKDSIVGIRELSARIDVERTTIDVILKEISNEQSLRGVDLSNFDRRLSARDFCVMPP